MTNQFKHVVVLTGAGISAESGLKTFRDHDGLWEGHQVEDVATPEAFERAAGTVHRFYNARRAQLVSSAKPNLAHFALAKFEASFEGEFTLVTQNVDDLHERAGSKKVCHMHGELLKALCAHCQNTCSWRSELNTDSHCPSCERSGNMRPDIVWFGEMPKHMDKIQRAIENCDLFVSIGTSGHVYPAAGFVQQAHHAEAQTIELNLESTHNPFFSKHIRGSATKTVPSFFDQI